MTNGRRRVGWGGPAGNGECAMWRGPVGARPAGDDADSAPIPLHSQLAFSTGDVCLALITMVMASMSPRRRRKPKNTKTASSTLNSAFGTLRKNDWNTEHGVLNGKPTTEIFISRLPTVCPFGNASPNKK